MARFEVPVAADFNGNFNTLNTTTIPVASGGTNLTTGTSGGVLGFTAATTIASSAALAVNGVVIGGGAGATPTATTAGTANQVFRVPDAGGAPAFGTVATDGIADDAVTYAKIQNVSATSRFLGRITAAAGNTEELTGTQATTLLDNFTSTLKGLAPLSGGGTTNFLRADGTWSAPASFTGLTTIQLVRKTAAETVNNSTTLQNDDALVAALAANEVVVFLAHIYFNATTVADFKYTWTVPAGATIRWNHASAISTDTASTIVTKAFTDASGTTQTAGGDGTTANRNITLLGVAANGTTAGDLQFQWAQNTAEVSNALVEANSFLLVFRV